MTSLTQPHNNYFIYWKDMKKTILCTIQKWFKGGKWDVKIMPLTKIPFCALSLPGPHCSFFFFSSRYQVQNPCNASPRQINLCLEIFLILSIPSSGASQFKVSFSKRVRVVFHQHAWESRSSGNFKNIHRSSLAVLQIKDPALSL